MRLFAAVVIGFSLLCSCTTVRQAFIDKGLERASFELECPANELKLKGLNYPLDSVTTAGALVGVDGCGRRAVYFFAYGQEWLLSSAQPKEKHQDQSSSQITPQPR